MRDDKSWFCSSDLSSESQILRVGTRGVFARLGSGVDVRTLATVSLGHLVEPFASLPFSSDEFDAYIIVSFVNATLVLSIGETVEEVTDSGFLGTTPTLSCSLLGEDALVQVRGSPEWRSGVLRE